MLVLLIGPSTVLTSALVKNTQAMQAYLTDDELVIPPPDNSIGDLPIIGEKLEALWQEASDDPEALFGQYEAEIVKFLNWLASTALVTGLNILLFVFSIILAGLFMASASGVKEALMTVFTRVAGDQGAQLTNLAHDTIQSVVRGILGIAFMQALLAGIGFVVMGIPASGILAVICLILAVVQIDILLILIPLSIYEFTNPDVSTGLATVFLIWNIGVGLLNNVLKPILLAQGVEAPMAVIFIGAIGGMILTGIIGLFIGAVVMVLGYTLFMSWVRQQV
jgi:predicted PurR-regulated permease PerM